LKQTEDSLLQSSPKMNLENLGQRAVKREQSYGEVTRNINSFCLSPHPLSPPDFFSDFPENQQPAYASPSCEFMVVD
jgi:hypothetical protein